jgi:hypothetical protein
MPRAIKTTVDVGRWTQRGPWRAWRDDDCQYRIKSSTESFERVAQESQLAVVLGRDGIIKFKLDRGSHRSLFKSELFVTNGVPAFRIVS